MKIFRYIFPALVSAAALLAQAPRIDSITPNQAPIAGGTAISIRGANFSNATITIDKVAVNATSIAADEIRFNAPKHDNGYAILNVATPAGAVTTRLLYIPPALKDLPPGYITTIAGVGRYWGEYGPAREASVDPGGISYGSDGALYLPQASRDQVLRIRPDGILEPFAGKGLNGCGGSSAGNGGPATDALLCFPRTAFVEANGDVTIDADDHRLWRVEAATGIIRVITGTGKPGFSGDGGPAINAEVNGSVHPTGDGKGTIWFIDTYNARIRRITPDGKIDTICGTGIRGFSGDGGPAIFAQIDIGNSADAGSLAYDPDGFLYLADAANHRIRRIDLHTGTIDTFIGPSRNFGANLLQINSLAAGPGGDIYFSATHEILHVTRDGQLRERFGTTQPNAGAPTFDGTPLSNVTLDNPSGLALEPQGNLVYFDHRLLRMNRASGVLETVAGVGPAAYGEDGPALAASPIEKTAGPFPDLAVLPSGEILFSGARLRKIGLDGRLSVVAGAGQNFGSVQEGPAIDTRWVSLGLDRDAAGNLYYSTYEHIVKVDPQGSLQRFTDRPGPAGCGFSGDGGPAHDAILCQPFDVFLDSAGNVFIADTNNNRIRRVDAKTGIIATVAGSGPSNGWENFFHGSYCGDGGPAINACLNSPMAVAVNSQGEMYIIEGPTRLRKVDRNGNISTVGRYSFGNLSFMAVDQADNLYVNLLSGVARIAPDGSSRLLAGQAGAQGFLGDGGPASAALCDMADSGVGFDAEGNLYFVDSENRRIRAVRFGAVLAPAGSRAQIGGGTPQTAPIATRFNDPLAVIVLDNTGRPAGNVRVDFTAPASGASCAPANANVLTDRKGRAEFVCIANTSIGGFNVTAAALGSNITLTFALGNTAPRLASNSLVNGASFLNGPVAPGELVTIFGAGVGPSQLVQAAPVGGRFGTQLAGVRVRFNGTEAPVLFARFDQVAVVAPYSLDGAASAQVVVEYAGVASNAITVPAGQASPGIFSGDSSGRGQGAVLNQDNSVNSAANPADRGSIIVLFCTGEGQTDPPGVDGKLASDVYPKPKLPVSVMIGGQAADVLYYGAAPTLVAGVLQVNARVPSGIAAGSAVAVSIAVGNTSSPAGVTVAIR